MRRSAANNAGNVDEMDVDDVTSDVEAENGTNNTDVESDEFEEPDELFRTSTYDLAQQEDFVGLI